MKLKVFVPDWDDELVNSYCTPLLYPFLQKALSPLAIVKKYGDWVNEVLIVSSLPDCDIAILKYDINYYYELDKTNVLATINTATLKAGKLLVCTTKGDAAITPKLQHFHLYRWSGYTSKNKGNQFALPVFIADPLLLYNDEQLFIHQQKTEKPFIGFCGQGKSGLLKWCKDAAHNIFHKSLKLLGKRLSDDEPLQSSTYTRSQLLDTLEKSPLIITAFIRYKKYRNGATSKEEKEAGARTFFSNILDTQYTLCYRGAGNFSVRLFETMACGRIPVIVLSDNLLPLPEKIDWNRFPVIQSSERNKIAQQLSVFHNNISESQFVLLQQYARDAWEQYLTYNGFMRTITDSYMQTTAAQLFQTTIIK